MADLAGYISDTELYYEGTADSTNPDAHECCGASGTPGTPDSTVDDPTKQSDPYIPPGDITIQCIGDGVVPEGGQGVDGSDDWKA